MSGAIAGARRNPSGGGGEAAPVVTLAAAAERRRRTTLRRDRNGQKGGGGGGAALAPDELVAAAPPSRGHALGVVAAAAYLSGAFAATSFLKSSVRVFDVNSNSSVPRRPRPPSEVYGLQFDPKVTPPFDRSPFL
uniref:Uncharacterized protein n=1 Tax=Ananas comosus var. bracteatus TaxID=296719 RepID=A0A6V7PI13_ANACO|nr:unnamed protein product [Ananas comosus var. bracteatus]